LTRTTGELHAPWAGHPETRPDGLKDMADIRRGDVALGPARQTGSELEEAHPGRPFGDGGFLFELPDELFDIPSPPKIGGGEAIPVTTWRLPRPAGQR